METETPIKKRSKGSVKQHLLKYPIPKCNNCGYDLLEASTPNIEFGVNDDNGDIVTGFCPMCGRGYPMIEPGEPKAEPKKEVEKEVEAVGVPAELETFDYPEIQKVAQLLGIKSNQKKPALIAAIRAKQEE